jgi:hypothetical protein
MPTGFVLQDYRYELAFSLHEQSCDGEQGSERPALRVLELDIFSDAGVRLLNHKRCSGTTPCEW